MKKKDYEMIAGTFKAYADVQIPLDETDLTIEESDAIKQAHKDLAERLAENLERDNPNFDRNRFLTACGILSDEKMEHFKEVSRNAPHNSK